MKMLLLLFFFIFTTNSFAEQCEIEVVDLTEALQSEGNNVITAFNLTDSRSNEPIRRYVQLLPDGSIVIVEQKHCMIYNLTITVLLPEGLPIDKVPSQLSNTLNKTLVWKKWFGKLDAEEILRNEIGSERFTSNIGKIGSFTYSLHDKIRAEDENSDVILDLVNLESGALPFEKIISLYIGVGGL